MTRSERSAQNRVEHAARRVADVAARSAARSAERDARIAAWRAAAQPQSLPTPLPAEPEPAPIRAKRSPSANRVAGGIRSGEKRAESDDAVRVNLPAEQWPAFDAWKRKRLPASRMTRTEAFEQWAHDHAGDVEALYYAACESAADAYPAETETDYTARQQASEIRP